MRIKKYKKNEYSLSDDQVWVRNLCSKEKNFDINYLYENDKKICLANEYRNIRRRNLNNINFNKSFSDIIICSDGFKWSEKQFYLSEILNDQARIIGTNGSLREWKMVGSLSDKKRVMNYYFINNPYKEAISYLPTKHSYYPNAIFSIRTNPDFIDAYRSSDTFWYSPPEESNYSIPKNKVQTHLDDYRNPICGAVDFAYKLGAKKIFLFCCDESFTDYRDASIEMENGLYQYPQQIMSQKILDKQFYWLKKNNVEIFDCSSGIKYKNATYITEEELVSFFQRSDKNE